MQVTTLSFYRFRGLWPRIWAFVHMELGKRPLRRLPDVGFHKILGTGSGVGFDPFPNFSVYAILATWPSLAVARERVREGQPFGRYRRMAHEEWTLFLEATRSRGHWDARAPFEPTADRSTGASKQGRAEGASDSVRSLPIGPATSHMGVITRAKIRSRHLIPFWRSVPAISAALGEHPALRFQIGMGELPVVQLMTFSLWEDRASMQDFAYRAPSPHPPVLRRSRSEGWFKEELFARFRVLDSAGTWNGRDPLAERPGVQPLTVAAS
jgi:spheroidene monooxygenase